MTKASQSAAAAYLIGGLEAAQGREQGTAWGLDNLAALIEGRASEAVVKSEFFGAPDRD